MEESELEFNSPSQLPAILDLLQAAGFPNAGDPEISASDRLAAGISWCIAKINRPGHQLDVFSDEIPTDKNEIEDLERMEEDLSRIGCPHLLRLSKDGQFDIKGTLPVVQWLTDRIRAASEDNQHGNHRKIGLLTELQQLKEKINNKDANAAVQRLRSLAETLKGLEQQESEFQISCNTKRSELDHRISTLAGKLAIGYDSRSPLDCLDLSLSESVEERNSQKKELATLMREILSLKRLVDDMPTPSELIQYERRISELFVYIQGKHAQTRKHYATYNTLLEIKELMLKETSLLNSITSQFQDAITSAAGRVKLIDSMEGILRGIQQKLEKVQLGLQEEQKVCNAVKYKYAGAHAEQRHCYSLLKAFQEECSKNEKLRSQNST